MDWLKRMFAEFGVRIHAAMFDPLSTSPDTPSSYQPGHIDVKLVPLRPGLCVYNPDDKPRDPELWELFKINDWELIPAARPVHMASSPLGLYAGPNFSARKTWISMNTFSIGPKTICVEAHETAYCEQLDKLGLEVIPIPYDKVGPFGGQLHCTTLDIYREGTLVDYFPKQIKGY